MSPALRLLRDSLPGRRTTGVAVAWIAAEAVPTILTGSCVTWSIRAVDRGSVTGAVGWMVVLTAALVCHAVATRRSCVAIGRVVEHVRDRLTEDVVAGSVARLARTGRPDPSALTQAASQVDIVRTSLAAILRTARNTVVPLLGACVGIVALEPRLAIPVVVPVLLGLLLAIGLVPTLRRVQLRATLAEEEVGRATGQLLADQVELRRLGACGPAQDRVVAAALRAEWAARRQALAAVAPHLVVAVAGYLPIVSTLAVTSHLVAAGRLDRAAVVGVFAYLLTALLPAVSGTAHLTGGLLLQLSTVLGRLAVLAEERRVATCQPERHVVPGVVVRARALGFAYEERAPVLEALDVDLRRGDLLAILGASGSGKSTLCELIAGLRHPTSGSVSVSEGLEVCWVPQHPHVFPGTLRENLLYLCRDQDAVDLAGTVAIFGLDTVVEAVGGLDSVLTPDDRRLTDADRQRVALARGYLSGAGLLLLDEATSRLPVAEEVRLEQLLRSGDAPWSWSRTGSGSSSAPTMSFDSVRTFERHDWNRSQPDEIGVRGRTVIM